MTADDEIIDQSILVTGATGSFGRRFLATILKHHKPKRIVIYSRDELKQFEMQQQPEFQDPRLRYFIGDVRDVERLEMAMRGIDIVIHAAALKQVPTAEYNPFECIRTNVHGAENVVQASIRTGVRKVVALSTDKASNPVNLYGASKLASDKIFIAANNLSGKGGPRFSVVRYGNVMGSRGSVIELYQRLVKGGAKSLPVTDERMTRFWITLQQGVDFVLGSLKVMRGGEIYVPKIPSMRVTDLAAALGPELPTHTIGIRPGEKLHEMMISEDDARTTVECEDYYAIEPSFPFWERAHSRLESRRTVTDGFTYRSDNNTEWLDSQQLRALLKLA